jgi:hypothetical protein
MGQEAVMKLLRVFLIFVIFGGAMLTFINAKPEYGKKEKKACTFCHPAGKFKELTDAGKFYKAHNHSLEGYTQ